MNKNKNLFNYSQAKIKIYWYLKYYKKIKKDKNEIYNRKIQNKYLSYI